MILSRQGWAWLDLARQGFRTLNPNGLGVHSKESDMNIEESVLEVTKDEFFRAIGHMDAD